MMQDRLRSERAARCEITNLLKGNGILVSTKYYLFNPPQVLRYLIFSPFPILTTD